ncbi:hypothetical protein BT96DRAFT_940551 [Gymnopus androsaceus JB14]|uniref:Uncharacterized protein n=1 Tax=Gymnopus androsaceus JB14 TaxID=1447944 RepID=A0A6A4HIV4_9AGAR|nr:hypothetical protein BT96DRAFT_940551 [Gymnopus androsaceus JB14]
MENFKGSSKKGLDKVKEACSPRKKKRKLDTDDLHFLFSAFTLSDSHISLYLEEIHGRNKEGKVAQGWLLPILQYLLGLTVGTYNQVPHRYLQVYLLRIRIPVDLLPMDLDPVTGVLELAFPLKSISRPFGEGSSGRRVEQSKCTAANQLQINCNVNQLIGGDVGIKTQEDQLG